MAKDKKGKKANKNVDGLKKEYEDSLELLKAKHKQLDGMLREVEIYLNELKESLNSVRETMKPLDE